LRETLGVVESLSMRAVAVANVSPIFMVKSVSALHQFSPLLRLMYLTAGGCC
jgi:hypothetical protein